jgi:hypothetical protein
VSAPARPAAAASQADSLLRAVQKALADAPRPTDLQLARIAALLKAGGGSG